MYNILIITLTAGILTQFIKVIIDGIKKRFAWNDLFKYGGMPSSHTAFVVSLTLSIGFYEGWDTGLFVLSLIFAILVIRDAIGLRQQIGQQAKEVNTLIETLTSKNILHQEYPHLEERVGHTGLQVLVGGAIGAAVSLIFILFLF